MNPMSDGPNLQQAVIQAAAALQAEGQTLDRTGLQLRVWRDTGLPLPQIDDAVRAYLAQGAPAESNPRPAGLTWPTVEIAAAPVVEEPQAKTVAPPPPSATEFDWANVGVSTPPPPAAVPPTVKPPAPPVVEPHVERIERVDQWGNVTRVEHFESVTHEGSLDVLPEHIRDLVEPVLEARRVAESFRGPNGRIEDKIGAIKAVRDASGLGLAEAKELVEAVERGREGEPVRLEVSRTTTRDPISLARDLVVSQGAYGAGPIPNKLEIIQRLRQETGISLADAKNIVDALERSRPGASSGSGCTVSSILIVLGAVGVAMLLALVLAAWREPEPTGPRVLADGIRFAEGPVQYQGRLLFSDIPADTIYEIAADQKRSVFRHPSGKANGNELDAEGRLITCEHVGRRVVRLEADGSLTVLADEWQGKSLNSPNDAAIAPDGSVYFTDPPYGVPAELRDLDFSGIYRVHPNGKLELLTRELARPNGLDFSPDGATLYVADTETNRVLAFPVSADGSLGQARLLSTQPNPDGLQVAGDGTIYVATFAAVVQLNPQGTVIRSFGVPQPATNVLVLEDEGRLIVTAGSHVLEYSLAQE